MFRILVFSWVCPWKQVVWNCLNQGLMDKQTMVHPHNGILRRNKKKMGSPSRQQLAWIARHCAEWKMPVLTIRILCESVWRSGKEETVCENRWVVAWVRDGRTMSPQWDSMKDFGGEGWQLFCVMTGGGETNINVSKVTALYTLEKKSILLFFFFFWKKCKTPWVIDYAYWVHQENILMVGG